MTAIRFVRCPHCRRVLFSIGEALEVHIERVATARGAPPSRPDVIAQQCKCGRQFEIRISRTESRAA